MATKGASLCQRWTFRTIFKVSFFHILWITVYLWFILLLSLYHICGYSYLFVFFSKRLAQRCWQKSKARLRLRSSSSTKSSVAFTVTSARAAGTAVIRYRYNVITDCGELVIIIYSYVMLTYIVAMFLSHTFQGLFSN